MELMSAYLYNQIPFQTIDILPDSVGNLISYGWFEDVRKSAGFSILHRRIKIENQYYKMTLRFKRNPFDNTLELDMPVPFMIVLCDLKEDGGKIRFVDTVVYHSKQIKTVSGYFEKGIPPELIGCMHTELKACLIYKQDRSNVTPDVDIDVNRAIPMPF